VVVLVTTRAEPSSPRIGLLTLDVLDDDAGVVLFSERYTGRGGTWSPERDGVAAHEIVHTLGGLPLAIELAAARAARTHLPLAVLAEELRAPDALARLSDPLDPSVGVRYSLGKTLLALTSTQRARFTTLGLLDGPAWPLPVVERLWIVATQPAVATETREVADEAAPVRADLEALIAYSLVSVVAPGEDNTSDAPRIRLHPLVRDLAREECTQLTASVQRDLLAGLMAGVQAWVYDHRAVDPASMAVLARDEELIVGALRAAAREQVELPLVVATNRAFDNYLFSHDLALREELAKLQLSSARENGDHRGELTALHRLMSTLAFTGRNADGWAERYAYGREAVDVARSLDDPKELASALGAASAAAMEAGHPDEARAFDEEGRRIGLSLHPGPGMAGVFTNLADAAARVGNLREASDLFAQALSSARMGGVHLNTMNILLHTYADVCALLGDYTAAARYEGEAVQLVQSMRDGSMGAYDLENLGEFALWTGDAARAVRIFEEALQMFQSPYFWYETEMIAHVQGNLAAARGEIARQSGDSGAARQGFEEALTIFEARVTPHNHLARNYEDFVRERLAMIE
jgi:tetratricopeptide (TPR) repeat protein